MIAEGVETEAQAAFLLDERCQEAQGYLYSTPLPAAEFETFLRNHHLALQTDKGDKAPSRTRKIPHRATRAPGRRALRR